MRDAVVAVSRSLSEEQADAAVRLQQGEDPLTCAVNSGFSLPASADHVTAGPSTVTSQPTRAGAQEANAGGPTVAPSEPCENSTTTMATATKGPYVQVSPARRKEAGLTGMASVAVVLSMFVGVMLPS